MRHLEDVQVGQELPPLEKTITPVNMMMYGASTWDFVRLHYDTPFVREAGFDGIFVDRQMLGAHLAQMVVAWAGDPALLRKLGMRYRQFVYPGEKITCRGRVTEVRAREGIVRCELWVENEKGERVLEPGYAEVALPQRRPR